MYNGVNILHDETKYFEMWKKIKLRKKILYVFIILWRYNSR